MIIIDSHEFFTALGYEVCEQQGERFRLRHPSHRAGRRFWRHIDCYTWRLYELTEMRDHLRRAWRGTGRIFRTDCFDGRVEICLIDLCDPDDVGCDVKFSCSGDSEGEALMQAVVAAYRLTAAEREAAQAPAGTGASEEGKR